MQTFASSGWAACRSYLQRIAGCKHLFLVRPHRALMTEATVIPLKSWQDPQGDVVLLYSERECSIFFPCWLSSGKPADYIGHLSFEHASAVRSFGREFLPYRLPEHRHRSYILAVPDSDMVREYAAYRRQQYRQFPPRPAPKQFVVVGHDIYHEILAAGFTESTIPRQEISDERLFRLVGAV
jgi:hypothetical protein